MKTTSKKPSTVGKEAAQVGRFGIVGVANTLIDFGLLNLITRSTNLNDVTANVFSASVAMVFSFFANRYFVFHAGKQKSLGRQALEFFPITAFGVIVVQAAVIYFFEQLWTWPVHVVVSIFTSIGVIGLHVGPITVDDKFVITNGVKVLATIASLTWNYIMYKKVVFKDTSQ